MVFFWFVFGDIFPLIRTFFSCLLLDVTIYFRFDQLV